MKLIAFKPKKCPVLTRGRAQHFAFGVGAVAAPGAVSLLCGWSSSMLEVSQWGLVFVWFYALLWEALTPVLAMNFFKSWAHPYGDYIDWVAYILGGVLSLLPMSIFNL